MTVYNFSVDAQLLRELGERLVGRPHIALAEMVKNSYDADASKVVIEFRGDEISVTDDGHGMSEDDFVRRWMRVGTTRKQQDRLSPLLQRPLTGSKGVGRLAAQLLARDIEIQSTALVDMTTREGTLERAIRARIDWREAVRAGDLTDIEVDVVDPGESPVYSNGSEHGTSVTMRSLTETWDADSFRDLAEQVWALQSPFDEGRDGFVIEMRSPYPDVLAAFDDQMHAIFDIWVGKVTGRLLPVGKGDLSIAAPLPGHLPDDEVDSDDGLDQDDDPFGDLSEGAEAEPGEDAEVMRQSRADELRTQLPARVLEATIELRDGATRTVQWQIAHCAIQSMELEYRVFELRYRQPKGIKVNTAREYLGRFGGVAVYDNRFRLPYYGAENDWLAIERDFAARRTGSDLVPKALRLPRGLLQLPRNAQLFGEVRVSTSVEQDLRSAAGYPDVPGLTIQVTRDRLVDNDAYQQLRVMTRATLDAYAMEQARAELERHVPNVPDGHEPPAPASRRFQELREVLQESQRDIPQPVYKALETAVEIAVETVQHREGASRTYASILGALATAGMTSLAYEHEMSKQVGTITALARRLARLAPDLDHVTGAVVREAAGEMRDWARRAGRIRQVFKPLVTRESRERVERFSARRTVLAVAKQAEALSGGVPVDAGGVPETLKLPAATYPAWSSVVQNILVNAYNAMLDVDVPLLRVVGGGDDDRGFVEFQDNGVGVDIERAAALWEPFERRLMLPPEREEAGLGGMGLGLTIIRMVADEIGVRVRFVAPPDDYKTAIRIEWGMS